MDMVTRAREARPRGELAEQCAVRAAGAAGAARSPIFDRRRGWWSLPPLN